MTPDDALNTILRLAPDLGATSTQANGPKKGQEIIEAAAGLVNHIQDAEKAYESAHRANEALLESLDEKDETISALRRRIVQLEASSVGAYGRAIMDLQKEAERLAGGATIERAITTSEHWSRTADWLRRHREAKG